MISPLWGPFLFDTSAESWLGRPQGAAVQAWFREYTTLHGVQVSAVTVVERARGYGLLARPAIVAELALMLAIAALASAAPARRALRVDPAESLRHE